MSNTLVEVKNLKKYFSLGRGREVRAVDDVSFSIEAGETLGLVGESGCGKSTLGKMLINLLEPTAGEIFFDGYPLFGLNSKERKNFRKATQIIFQDPYSSLNPRMKVLDIVGEGVDIFRLYKQEERKEYIENLLDLVGLKPAHGNRYPHEFSGGQRQRIGIARAISLNPRFIICDEPISALDVSIQAQIINLLNDLQQKLGLTYLFVSHDIKMVKLISDRIAVMYLGKIVEIGSSNLIFNQPLHPYAQALISAVPIADPSVERARNRIKLQGDLPSPLEKIDGCVFASRCPKKQAQCSEAPRLERSLDGRYVACHFPEC